MDIKVCIANKRKSQTNSQTKNSLLNYSAIKIIKKEKKYIYNTQLQLDRKIETATLLPNELLAEH